MESVAEKGMGDGLGASWVINPIGLYSKLKMPREERVRKGRVVKRAGKTLKRHNSV